MNKKNTTENEINEVNLHEIMHQIRVNKKLFVMDIFKEMNQEEKTNYLYEYGFSKEEIVELIGKKGGEEPLNLSKEYDNYENFAILKKADFTGKQIAVVSSFLCKFHIFHFLKEREVLTHFSYRVCSPM